MSSIIAIPGGTVSNQFAATQTISQLSVGLNHGKAGEPDFHRTQALNLPSDNPTAALEAVNIQRTLDQLTQVGTNLTTNQSYLTQTDTTLSSIANLLNSAQSTASSAASTRSAPRSSRRLPSQIGQLVPQLVDVGEHELRRPLSVRRFPSRPSSLSSGRQLRRVRRQRQFAIELFDVSQFFRRMSAEPKHSALLSTSVQGTANLTPILTAETPLST